jgi:hypothetical protein
VFLYFKFFKEFNKVKNCDVLSTTTKDALPKVKLRNLSQILEKKKVKTKVGGLLKIKS